MIMSEKRENINPSQLFSPQLVVSRS